MKHYRGFAGIGILAILALIALGGAGWWYASHKPSNPEEVLEHALEPSSELAVYRNEEYGFSLSYPSDWRVGYNSNTGFQLFNYEEWEVDGNFHDFDEGQSKIEFSVYPREQIGILTWEGDQPPIEPEREVLIDEQLASVYSNGTVYAIPVRNHSDIYLVMYLYGDEVALPIFTKMVESIKFDRNAQTLTEDTVYTGNGYRITVPPGWVIIPSGKFGPTLNSPDFIPTPGKEVMEKELSGDPTGRAKEGMTFVVGAEGDPLNESIHNPKAYVSFKMGIWGQPSEKNKEITLGGQPAHYYLQENTDGTWYMQISSVRNGKEFIIYGYGSGKQESAEYGELDALFDSLAFTDGDAAAGPFLRFLSPQQGTVVHANDGPRPVTWKLSDPAILEEFPDFLIYFTVTHPDGGSGGLNTPSQIKGIGGGYSLLTATSTVWRAKEQVESWTLPNKPSLYGQPYKITARLQYAGNASYTCDPAVKGECSPVYPEPLQSKIEKARTFYAESELFVVVKE